MKNRLPQLSPYPEPELSSLKAEDIVIFGAGLYGSLALVAFKSLGIPIACFCDNDPKKHGTKLLDVPIVGIDEIRRSIKNPVIYIAVHPMYTWDEIAQQLDHLNYKYYDCWKLFKSLRPSQWKTEELSITTDSYGIVSNESNRDRFFTSVSTYLWRLEQAVGKKMLQKKDIGDFGIRRLFVIPTERCTLRCRNCEFLMPYFKTPKDSDINELLESLDRIMDSVDYVHRLDVLGGEIFLYKDLSQLLEKSCSYEKCSQILITTNATIFPNNIVLDSLKNEKIMFRISDYGSLSKKKDDWIDFLEKHDIPYWIQRYSAWYDLESLADHHRTPKQLRHEFENCRNNFTRLHLLHGKLYRCPRAAFMHELKAIPKREKDWIDVRCENNPEFLRRKLFGFLCDKDYNISCNYCVGSWGTGKQIPAAEQVSHPLSYKKFD